MEQEKREKVIKIRATESEYSELQKRNTKARLAEWMREYCLGEKPTRSAQVPPVDPALLRQLAGIGNNINQIAHACNIRVMRNDDLPTESEGEQFLKSIREGMMQLELLIEEKLS